MHCVCVCVVCVHTHTPTCVCVCVCMVGGSEIIAWQQPAVLIPLYLCLPSPPLNWKQMRVAGDDRPSEGPFNYCDANRQDG